MTRLEDIGIKLTSLAVDGPYVIKMEGVYSDWSVVIWLHEPARKLQSLGRTYPHQQGREAVW